MNISQRKVLERLVKQEINEKNNEINGFTRKRESEMLKENKENNLLKAKEIAKDIKEKEKEVEQLDKVLKRLGYERNKYNDDEPLEAKLTPKQDKQVSEEECKKRKDIGKAETTILAKVWGIEGEFSEIMAEIQKELAKL